jgi:hypothetical protein
VSSTLCLNESCRSRKTTSSFIPSLFPPSITSFHDSGVFKPDDESNRLKSSPSSRPHQPFNCFHLIGMPFQNNQLLDLTNQATPIPRMVQ